MKELIKKIKRKYYARKMYKAIRLSTPIINGNKHTCYIDKKHLGKNFENTKYKLWLPQIMKNKYGLRVLKCEISELLKNYYLVTYYKK